jgi:hypothetical protein
MKQYLILLSFVLLAACKKEEAVPIKDGITLLTQSPWKLIGEYQRHNNLPFYGSNILFPLPCEADNEYTFTKAGVYQLREGASKCSPSAPDVLVSANWIFIQPDKEMLIDNDYFSVQQLDDEQLVLLFTRYIGGRSYDMKRVFGH